MTAPDDVRARRAVPAEQSHLAPLYASWGYGGGMRPEDVVFVAERGGATVGIVRRTWEHGTLMLRGMYVAPEARGHGVGARLLATFVGALDADAETRGHACYGIPFAHLARFYGHGGFAFIPLDKAPRFLRERVARYTAEGHRVAVMRRPPAARRYVVPTHR